MTISSKKMFSELTNVEKELEVAKRLYAKSMLKRIGKNFEEVEKNVTIVSKFVWYIKDFFCMLELKRIKKKHDTKIGNLTSKDKEEKIIRELTLNKERFILLFQTRRYFDICSLSNDRGSIDISDIKYETSMIIKKDDICSEKQYLKKFDTENEALEYLENLIDKIKSQKIREILTNILTEKSAKVKNLRKKTRF